MSHAATIQADAKLVHEDAGESVVYVPAAGNDAGAGVGESVATFAMSVGEAMRLRESDERRTVTQKLVISVPKADVTAVDVKGDRVTVPGSWVGSAEATVTWRVAVVLRDRSSPGSWVLGMDK